MEIQGHLQENYIYFLFEFLNSNKSTFLTIQNVSERPRERYKRGEQSSTTSRRRQNDAVYFYETKNKFY